jgi:hypothetical protein
MTAHPYIHLDGLYMTHGLGVVPHLPPRPQALMALLYDTTSGAMP